MSSQARHEEQDQSSSSNHVADRPASHSAKWSQLFFESYSLLNLLKQMLDRLLSRLARLHPGIMVLQNSPPLELPYNTLLPPNFTFTRVEEVDEPEDQMWQRAQAFKVAADEKLDELFNFDDIILLYSRLGEFHGSRRKRVGFDKNDNFEDPRFLAVLGSESGIREYWSQILDVINAVGRDHHEVVSQLPIRFYFCRLDHDTERQWNMQHRCKWPLLIGDQAETTESLTSTSS